MTEFLAQWGHWGFIAAAYAVWMVLTGLDCLLPYLKSRRLWREIAEQRRRELQRRTP